MKTEPISLVLHSECVVVFSFLCFLALGSSELSSLGRGRLSPALDGAGQKRFFGRRRKLRVDEAGNTILTLFLVDRLIKNQETSSVALDVVIFVVLLISEEI